MRSFRSLEKFSYLAGWLLFVNGQFAESASAPDQPPAKHTGEDWASFVDRYAVDIVAKLQAKADHLELIELSEAEAEEADAAHSLQDQVAEYYSEERDRFTNWLSEQPVGDEVKAGLDKVVAADKKEPPAAAAGKVPQRKQKKISPELELLEQLKQKHSPAELAACLAHDKVCGHVAKDAGFAGGVGGAPTVGEPSLLQPGEMPPEADDIIPESANGGIVGNALKKHKKNKYVDVSATQIKLFKELEKNMWRLDSVYAMNEKFNETRECIRKFAAPEWDMAAIVKLFSRVNMSSPESWELTATDLFNRYFNASAMGGVLNSMLSNPAKVKRIREVVVGNIRSFTAADLDEVNWFDSVSKLVHDFYFESMQEPGFEVLSCIERYILRGAYAKNVDFVHSVVKKTISGIRKQWDILLPTATGWIRDRFVEFFDTYPQMESLLKPVTGHASNMCMQKMRSSANAIDEYTKRWVEFGTVGEDYTRTVSSINASYLPETRPEDPQTNKAQALRVIEQMQIGVRGGLRNFFTEMEPTFMNHAVMPVTNVLLDILRSTVGSTQFMVQGALGYIPYVGPATHTLLAQMTEVSVAFMVQRLEEIAHYSLQVVFQRLYQNVNLITQVLTSEYAPRAWSPPETMGSLGTNGSGIVVAVYENRTDFPPQTVDAMIDSGAGAPTLGSAFEDDGSGEEQLARIDTQGTDGIVAGDPNEISRYDGTKRLMDSIFEGLPAHIQVVKPIVKPIVGLTRGVLPSFQQVLQECDSWTQTMGALAALMKPKFGR